MYKRQALGSVPVAAALLLYVFLADGSKTPVAYLAYAFSAWSLTVVCTSLLPAVGRGGGMVKQNRYVRRYLTCLLYTSSICCLPVRSAFPTSSCS